MNDTCPPCKGEFDGDEDTVLLSLPWGRVELHPECVMMFAFSDPRLHQPEDIAQMDRELHEWGSHFCEHSPEQIKEWAEVESPI